MINFRMGLGKLFNLIYLLEENTIKLGSLQLEQGGLCYRIPTYLFIEYITYINLI